MTKKEAIKFGEKVIALGLKDETQMFCEMAIEALKAQPCEDCVSRQTVIRTIYDRKSDFKNDFAQGFFADRIRDLPPVTPKPTECEDVVSRQAILKLPKKTMKNYFGEVVGDVVFIEDIKALPLVTPKRKTGKWIKSRDRYGNYHFTCPFCEYDIATKYAGTWEDNYCSNCGAKMEGESEKK